MAMLVLERNDFLFSFDLKSGYHPTTHEHWKYPGWVDFTFLLSSPLGFRWLAIFSPNWCAPC